MKILAETRAHRGTYICGLIESGDFDLFYVSRKTCLLDDEDSFRAKRDFTNSQPGVNYKMWRAAFLERRDALPLVLLHKNSDDGGSVIAGQREIRFYPTPHGRMPSFENLYLLREHRGQGLGHFMYRTCLDFISRDQRYTHVTGSIWSTNKRSIALAEHYGFVRQCTGPADPLYPKIFLYACNLADWPKRRAALQTGLAMSAPEL